MSAALTWRDAVALVAADLRRREVLAIEQGAAAVRSGDKIAQAAANGHALSCGWVAERLAYILSQTGSAPLDQLRALGDRPSRAWVRGFTRAGYRLEAEQAEREERAKIRATVWVASHQWRDMWSFFTVLPGAPQ